MRLAFSVCEQIHELNKLAESAPFLVWVSTTSTPSWVYHCPSFFSYLTGSGVNTWASIVKRSKGAKWKLLYIYTRNIKQSTLLHCIVSWYRVSGGHVMAQFLLLQTCLFVCFFSKNSLIILIKRVGQGEGVRNQYLNTPTHTGWSVMAACMTWRRWRRTTKQRLGVWI